METHHFIYTTMLHIAEAPQPSELLQTEEQAIETAKEISRTCRIKIRLIHPDDYRTICTFQNGEPIETPRP